jgi:hypothetical protein
VTVTVTVAAVRAAVVQVIEVELTEIPVQAVPPKVGMAPAKNPVPVIVTAVPPAIEPEFGETFVTVGAAK